MFRSMNGQAKIWGLGISLGGALGLLLWKGPVVLKAIRFDTTSDDTLVGPSHLLLCLSLPLATFSW